jgi:hypothetical protein
VENQMNQLRSIALILGCFPAGIMAQTPAANLTLGPAPPIAPGQQISLPLNLTGSSGLGITTIQFTITVPVGMIVGAPVPTGSASAAVFICAQPSSPPQTLTASPNTEECWLFGQSVTTTAGVVTVNENVLSDGPVGMIPVTVQFAGAGNVTIAITNTAASAPNGTDVAAVSLGALPFTLPIGAAACDLNGDGRIDGADVVIAENMLVGKIPITVSWAVSMMNVAEIVNTAYRISQGLASNCVVQ